MDNGNVPATYRQRLRTVYVLCVNLQRPDVELSNRYELSKLYLEYTGSLRPSRDNQIDRASDVVSYW